MIFLRLQVAILVAGLLAHAGTGRARRPPASTPAKHAKKSASAPSFDPAAINNPDTRDDVGPDSAGSAVVRMQILLDRAHFSPGEIDGRYGDNLRLAILGFEANKNLEDNGIGGAEVWDDLNADKEQALVPYVITADDLAGPFQPVPKDLMLQAKLKSLGYQSPEEELGEKFHLNPKLLLQLNPGKDLHKAGEQILVPNVQRGPLEPSDHVVVSKSKRTVTAFAADGRILAQYPATMGSEHDPLPIGDWKITGVDRNPWFNYNPALFWDAKPKDAKARIAPGPNNPVGLVWISLSKEHYGIHGTPEPANIGHTESHGCIRLTNWDALELASMVKPGTPAVLQE